MHALMLLIHVAVFDAALNGKSHSLFTLLLLVQFAEMKASALKKISEKNLFAMCCDGTCDWPLRTPLRVTARRLNRSDRSVGVDIVERFQLFIFVCFLYLYNVARHVSVLKLSFGLLREEWMVNLLYCLAIIYMSELVVDWYGDRRCVGRRESEVSAGSSAG
jgi:hypothetical protein